MQIPIPINAFMDTEILGKHHALQKNACSTSSSSAFFPSLSIFCSFFLQIAY